MNIDNLFCLNHCPSQKLNPRDLIGNASMLQNVTLFNGRFIYLEGTANFSG